MHRPRWGEACLLDTALPSEEVSGAGAEPHSGSQGGLHPPGPLEVGSGSCWLGLRVSLELPPRAEVSTQGTWRGVCAGRESPGTDMGGTEIKGLWSKNSLVQHEPLGGGFQNFPSQDPAVRVINLVKFHCRT